MVSEKLLARSGVFLVYLPCFTLLSHSGLLFSMHRTDIENIGNVSFDIVFVIMMPSIN